MTDDPLLHPDTIRDCSGVETTGQARRTGSTLAEALQATLHIPGAVAFDVNGIPLGGQLARIESKIDTLLHHFALESK